MNAVQIKKYQKKIETDVVEIPIPQIGDQEVLVKLKVAAVNHLEILNITGSVQLIQDYDMPLTIGNELTGVISEVGKLVSGFKKGDTVYTRLPLDKIGAFAEYVAAFRQSPLSFRAFCKMVSPLKYMLGLFSVIMNGAYFSTESG